MSFIEYQFPKEISFGSVGGMSFQTDIIETNSGIEARNSKWALPKARYNVAIGIRHQSDLETIRALHMVAKGRAFGFRYNDPLDHSVAKGFIGLGDGTLKEFQLVKRYCLTETLFFDRPIYCPIPNTIRLSVGGNEEKNWILLNKGKIQLRSPPEEGLEVHASFAFDVPVRFDCDYLPQRLDGFEVASIIDIPLVEISL